MLKRALVAMLLLLPGTRFSFGQFGSEPIQNTRARFCYSMSYGIMTANHVPFWGGTIELGIARKAHCITGKAIMLPEDRHVLGVGSGMGGVVQYGFEALNASDRLIVSPIASVGNIWYQAEQPRVSNWVQPWAIEGTLFGGIGGRVLIGYKYLFIDASYTLHFGNGTTHLFEIGLQGRV